jgi:hypothetical protein
VVAQRAASGMGRPAAPPYQPAPVVMPGSAAMRHVDPSHVVESG